jgi:predicted DNA-binding transcriptional regulator AlpA
MSAGGIIEGGFSRARTAMQVAGISRATLWRWSKSGLFPAPVAIGPGVTGWRNDDLIEWARDPAAWRARNAKVAAA